MKKRKLRLSLFWRTYAWLLLLLGGSLGAWIAATTLLDGAPRPAQAARELASEVRLCREALRLVDRGKREAIVQAIAAKSGLQLLARAATDHWQPLPDERGLTRLAQALRTELGSDTVVAGAVEGQPGLWVSFTVDREGWWLRAEFDRVQPALGPAWLGSIALLLIATLLAAVLVARRINRPLRDLSFAASRIREGDLDSRLDETTITSEIREVNVGFNRMARELAKVEEDRAVMLAGISHDLRTPLARLRLEAEMSVAEEEARAHMADDIAQLDAIIDKFMDYARPGESHLRPVVLPRLVDREAAAFRDPGEIRITSGKVAIDLKVMADEIELARVFSNLFENARRYGRTTETGIAVVNISYLRSGEWVICTVRDHGPGVAPDKLAQLTTPFFRGDAARTAATGAGLGLAIVEKAMQRMGGSVELANAPDGGLMVHLRLRHAR